MPTDTTGSERAPAAFARRHQLAAFVVLAYAGVWPAVKDLLRSIVRWRVGWVWYLVALGLMHASNNTVAFVWQMFAGPDQLRLWWLWCALWVAATALILAATGPPLRRPLR